MRSIIKSFIYLKNPWIVFYIPFNKTITLLPKAGDEIIIGNRQFINYMDICSSGWVYKAGIYQNGMYKFKVLEPYVLLEDFIQMYQVDNLKGKNVLDIGGLYGETAIVMCKELGVNKVFIYEPIKENFDLIINNIELNSCINNIEPFNLGVSSDSGLITVHTEYAPGFASFGIPGEKYKTTIEVISWDSLLDKHKKDQIFLAKVDCEGAEKHLVEANRELIKTIPNWVMETHSLKIENDMIKLFTSLGYRCELREKINKKMHVNVWCFSLDRPD